MKNTFKLNHSSHRLIAVILLFSLLLQSCGNSFNQLAPGLEESADDSPGSTKKLGITKQLVKQKLTSAGWEVTDFYEEQDELKVQAIERHGNFSSKPYNFSIRIASDIDLEQVSLLSPKEQERIVQFNPHQEGHSGGGLVRKEGLSGGMKKGSKKDSKGKENNNNEQVEKEGKDNEKEEETACKLENNFPDYQMLFELAKQGNAGAQFEMGKLDYLIYQQQPSEELLDDAREWLNQAAAQGDAEAIALLKEIDLIMQPEVGLTGDWGGAYYKKGDKDEIIDASNRPQCGIVGNLSYYTLDDLPDELQLKVLASLCKDSHEAKHDPDKKVSNESFRALWAMSQVARHWRGLILKEKREGTLVRTHGIENLIKKLADKKDVADMIQVHQIFIGLCGFQLRKNPFENNSLSFSTLYTKLYHESVPLSQDLIQRFYGLLIKKLSEIEIEEDDRSRILDEITLSPFFSLLLKSPSAEELTKLVTNLSTMQAEEMVVRIAQNIPTDFFKKLIEIKTFGQKYVRHRFFLIGLLQNQNISYSMLKEAQQDVLDDVMRLNNARLIGTLGGVRGLDDEGLRICIKSAQKRFGGNPVEKSEALDICTALALNHSLTSKQLAQVCDLFTNHLEDNNISFMQRLKFCLALSDHPHLNETILASLCLPGEVKDSQTLRSYAVRKMSEPGACDEQHILMNELENLVRRKNITLEELPKIVVGVSGDHEVVSTSPDERILSVSPYELGLLSQYRHLVKHLKLVYNTLTHSCYAVDMVACNIFNSAKAAWLALRINLYFNAK